MFSSLEYQNGILCFEGAPLTTAGEQFGTPLYIYSQPALLRAADEADRALSGTTPHLICYAVKANPSLAVIQTFARAGLGADVTSGGELHRALRAGVPAGQIVFSGVGKTVEEMCEGAAAGIRGFHVEVEDEIETLAAVSMEGNDPIPVALRVNPDVEPDTHPGVVTGQGSSKFGLPMDNIPSLVQKIRATSGLALRGLSMHIGSQITTLDSFRQAAGRLVRLARQIIDGGAALDYLDLGGGLGVRYEEEESAPSLAEWGAELRRAMGDLPVTLIAEPGRALAAGAGVLLTRVLAVKRAGAKTFVIVDAGMNDLIRPMLYGAYHPMWPVAQREDAMQEVVDVVGPVCETTDTLAAGRVLALPRPGDLLAVLNAGAYGMSMASNYNSRRRAAEVMLTGNGEMKLIRAQETYDDLVRGETLLE